MDNIPESFNIFEAKLLTSGRCPICKVKLYKILDYCPKCTNRYSINNNCILVSNIASNEYIAKLIPIK